MPIIAKHHHPDYFLAKDADYTPGQAWLDDTYVQWGGRGIVLGENSYTTAFFEAFPEAGGFIRGEGQTISEAEANAFRKWQKESACVHVLGRRGYTNGAGKCTRCGAFISNAFAPIPKLSEWRKLPDITLESILMGWLRTGRETSEAALESSRKHNRRTWLIARLHGIDLPPIPEEPMSDEQFMGWVVDPYRTACREALANWLQSDRCHLDDDKKARLVRQIEGHRDGDRQIANQSD